jgi:hypothetical protein
MRNLVQYSRVTWYCPCHKKVLLPSIIIWMRESPWVWILIKRLKIKLCWRPNSQQSVATVTPGKRDTVLDIPHDPQIGTLICIPYLTRQVSCLDTHQMGATYGKEGYSHKIVIATKQCKFTQSWLHQHMTSVFDTNQDRVKSCSRFSNSNRWKMIKITLPVIIITNVR